MTRILSYNILSGATRRADQVARIIQAVNPDVVGLVEASDPQVVEELARRLDMQYVISGAARRPKDWGIAVLSRWPIVYSQTHYHPCGLSEPVLEACVEEPGGRQITLFVVHLSAAFSHGWAGNAIRRREVRELLRITAAKRGTPHVVMGDFNALAPGDPFRASALLQYIVDLDRKRQQYSQAFIGHPNLDFVVPKPLRLFNPLLCLIPRSRLLSKVFDKAAAFYAPRGSINMLRNAGYVDCFRVLNPEAEGFTCPSASPAGRIDFIFASPELAESLSACYAVSQGDGVWAEDASDHLPVVAEFGEKVGMAEGKPAFYAIGQARAQ